MVKTVFSGLDELCLDGFGVFNAKGVNGDVLHDLRGAGLVVIVGAHGTDLVNDFDALNDLAEGGVLTVEVGGVLVHDEELAAGGVGSHGTGHGENTAVMLEIVFEAVAGKLALDAVAGAAGACALGVAALNHKAGDDTVEDDTVVKALVYKGDKVVDCVGGDFGVKLCLHDVAVFHFKGNYGIAH